MIICHLGKYYPPAPGGMETHLQTLARGQVACGADVRVVCVNHEPAYKTVEDSDGAIRVTRVSRHASLKGLDVCPGLMEVFRGLHRQPPDILHLHTPNPTMLLPLAVTRLPSPLLVMHHSDIVRQAFLERLHRPFERAVYRRAAIIAATSQNYAASSASLQRFRDKVRLLPMGLDLAPFITLSDAARAHAESYRARHPEPLWLCVGRLVYYKGMAVALDALREVAGRLVVIGTGPLEGELRSRAAKNGVADRVIWRGNASADELAGAYHAATALWFPSVARSEAYGLVQVEAMAAGCPVLNTSIAGSGVAWVSQHETTGLTVPPGDAGALAVAAGRLLSDPSLRSRLAQAGILRAQQQFDHRIMTRQSFDFYEQLLARKRGLSMVAS